MPELAYDRARTVDHMVQEVHAGRIEMAHIRSRLEQENVPDAEIRIVFGLVDGQVQRKVLQLAANQQHRTKLYGGLILCTLGIVVTLGTYFGIFDMRGYYLVAYGPIFVGGLLALSAYQNIKHG